MESSTVIHMRRYSHGDLLSIRETLLDIQSDAYADAMDDPFNRRFWWFVDHWGANPDFSCVMAYDGNAAVGFSYGAPARQGAEWWRPHWTPPILAESSTFHLSELMIRHRWRKIGLSRELHDALLAGRTEALSSLSVDVTHPKVQNLYESWGYFKVGEDQPFADSPLYATLVKELRARNSAEV
jgi:hypothetical protein